MVAHQPTAVQSADRIVLFDENKLLAIGTQAQLLAGNHYYPMLVEHETIS